VKRRITVTYASLIAAAVLPVSGTSPDISRCRYAKPIEGGVSVQEQILAAVLDVEVYSGTEPGFEDVRLAGDDGVEMPYLIDVMTETRTRTIDRTCTGIVDTLTEKGDNRIEVVAHLPEKVHSPTSLSFVTPLRDFQHAIRVFGAGKTGEWQLLVPEGLIFDYSRFMDVKNLSVPLPANSCVRFRIEIGNVTDEQESQLRSLTRHAAAPGADVETVTVQRRPFRIERIVFGYSVDREEVKGNVKRDYAPAKIAVDEEGGNTVVSVVTHREPLTGFVLDTSSSNFRRIVRVEVPERRDGVERWRLVGEGTVTRISFRGYNKESLQVTFQEQRSERYRVVIVNNDNPPLQVDGLVGRGNCYRLTFLASPSTEYNLYYGWPRAPEPSYDVAALVALLRQGQERVEVFLGDQIENTSYRAQISNVLGSRVLFGAAVVLMVGALGWGLFKAGKRIEELPEEGE